jgi:arginase
MVGMNGSNATSQKLSRLKVVAVRYRTATPAEGDERGVDAYRASGAYEAFGAPVEEVEPRLTADEGRRPEMSRLGLLNARIADAVAEGSRSGAGILLVGGNCAHATAVIGGLQQAHGAELRLGLVWFDAHGDFNTPVTSPSGMLGGMPVAVAAGLALPEWRESSRIAAPLPTDRIVLVGARNLDPAERELISATQLTLAAPAPGFQGVDLAASVDRLARHCDQIYLHIDADVLDRSLVPSHRTAEPHGPDLEQTMAAVDSVMACGRVTALALVSIYNQGEAGAVSMASGIQLLRGALGCWRCFAGGTTGD